MFAFHQPDYSTLNSSPDSKYTFLCLYRQTLPFELQLLEEAPPAHNLKNNCWCSLSPKFWWWPSTSPLLNDNLSLCESSGGFSMCLQYDWFKRCEHCLRTEFNVNVKFWRTISSPPFLCRQLNLSYHKYVQSYKTWKSSTNEFFW